MRHLGRMDWPLRAAAPTVLCPPALLLACPALQGSPTGRLLAYDPATRTTKLLADGIWFANGVALSGAPGQAFSAPQSSSSCVVRPATGRHGLDVCRQASCTMQAEHLQMPCKCLAEDESHVLVVETGALRAECCATGWRGRRPAGQT